MSRPIMLVPLLMADRYACVFKLNFLRVLAIHAPITFECHIAEHHGGDQTYTAFVLVLSDSTQHGSP
jgi:hypothetical protein